MSRKGQTVVLVRHGETEWSASGKHTSYTDVDLTEGGRANAGRLRDRLADFRFALVLSSPRLRARETARIAGFAGAEIDEDLVEWDYGEYEGLTTPEIREDDPGWTVWTHTSPGGETPAEVGARVDRVIERAEQADGDVALFAHGHVLRVFGARWIGLSPQDGAALALETAAVCELGYERERRVLWLWDDTGCRG